MVKTNLITGSLGSRETTSTLHLLTHKDPNEKWAVLVNKFREVGIDGALLAGNGVLSKEIPGGCMYCVSGLLVQVGLNTLLRQGKLSRLSTESTRLGHPKQILDLLTALVYEPWTDLCATLYVLDPHLLLNGKGASNEGFRDQLAAANIAVANGSDHATSEGKQTLERWWQQNGGDR